MATTETTGRTQIEAYLADIEAMWAAFDELCSGFGPDDWTGPGRVERPGVREAPGRPSGTSPGPAVVRGRREWTVGSAPSSRNVRRIRTLRFTMTPDIFNIAMLRRAVNPMMAMLRGEVKVKGFTKMRTMRKLFPEPDPDKPIVLTG